jgi:anti-sigma regulatory factor (Ser/Thr protein kinase)
MRAPAQLDQVRPLVAAARAVMDAALGPEGPLEDLELVAAELLNNAVEHGGTAPGAEVEIALEIAADRVLMAVSNPGADDACFVPLDDPMLPAGAEEGGYGRFLVHHLVDEVRYACEGARTVVTCVKRLTAPEAS